MLLSDQNAPNRQEEEFIEISIYGEVNINLKTMQQITFTKEQSKEEKNHANLQRKTFIEDCKQIGIKVEYV